MKLFLVVGCVSAALSVALGAFGAHGLENKISEKMLDVWKTGVQYQFYHSLGLIALSILMTKIANNSLLNVSGWLMISGMVLFSGSLYILSTSGIKFLGAITPIGGVAFIASWILMAIAAYQKF